MLFVWILMHLNISEKQEKDSSFPEIILAEEVEEEEEIKGEIVTGH